LSKSQAKIFEKLKNVNTGNINGGDSIGVNMGGGNSVGNMGGGNNGGNTGGGNSKSNSPSPRDEIVGDEVSNLSKMTAKRMKLVNVKGKKGKNSYNPSKIPGRVEVKKRGSILTDKDELDDHKLIEHILDGSPSPTKASKENPKLYINQEPNQGRFPSSIDNKAEFIKHRRRLTLADQTKKLTQPM